MKRPVPTVALHMQYKTSFLVARKIRGEKNLKTHFSETFLSFLTHFSETFYHSLHYQILFATKQ